MTSPQSEQRGQERDAKLVDDEVEALSDRGLMRLDRLHSAIAKVQLMTENLRAYLQSQR